MRRNNRFKPIFPATINSSSGVWEQTLFSGEFFTIRSIISRLNFLESQVFLFFLIVIICVSKRQTYLFICQWILNCVDIHLGCGKTRFLLTDISELSIETHLSCRMNTLQKKEPEVFQMTIHKGMPDLKILQEIPKPNISYVSQNYFVKIQIVLH